MKITCSMYNYEGKVSQTRGCDECHLHRPDASVVDQWTYRKKNPCPAVPRRGHEAGDSRKYFNFHSLGVNSRSCLFQQNPFFGIINTGYPP
jgi:hypothetical protein